MWSLILELGQGVIKKAHINNMEFTLVNGSTVSLKGSDRPDTLRGVSLAFVVLDEYGAMKPTVWEEVLRPALTDLEGSAVFIGTPCGRNHFWELYKQAELGKDPEWAAYHFTSYDNPLLKATEIEKAKETMSSFAFRQEFMANFEAKDSELFREEWLKFSTEEPKTGDYYITVDLAGFEEVGKSTKGSRLDNTAISIVKVNEDGWWVKEIIWGRWDLKATAEKIFRAVEAHQPISVGFEKGLAQQAVMSPLGDLMRQQNRYFRVELLSHGNKRKEDRIVWALQGRMEHKRVTLCPGEWNTEFLDELFQFPSSLTKDDLVDSLSYIDQLAVIPYSNPDDIEDNWEPLDIFAGY
jgi:phage terminase large subunit-like protein